MRKVLAVIFVCAAADLAVADTYFFMDALIQAGDSYDDVYVYDTSPYTTTIEMTGGTVYWYHGYDQSILNISGGEVTWQISSFEQSTINMSGGEVTYLYSYANSTINFRGGTVVGGATYGVCFNGDSTVNISGGTLNNIECKDNSTTNITGGQYLGYLYAGNSSMIHLYGYDFQYDPNAGGFGGGQFRGFWGDDTPFILNLKRDTFTHISLHSPMDLVCEEYPAMDFNKDCKVDFTDFAIFCKSWLECNLVQQSTCWE